MNEEEHEVTSLLTPQLALLVAAVMLFCAWYFGGHMAELKFNGREVQGEIVRIEAPNEAKNAQGRPLGPFYPVISFKDESGAAHRFTDSKGTMNYDKYSLGDKLPVLYRPESPDTTAAIDRGLEMWKTTGIFGSLGLLFLLSALARMQRDNRAV